MKLSTAIEDCERYLQGMPDGAFQDAIIRLLQLGIRCQEIHTNKKLDSAEACDQYEAEIGRE